MRPPSSLIYEPRADQGIPRGRDLFTFVTSAASHMMRTLQRPRKSRPSKRQVNHRRFLHNMIHRKFAEIEAANQQLSSAIFSREGQGTQTQSPICVSTDQSDVDPGAESSILKLPPSLSSISTSLSLSLFSPESTIPSNQPEEPGNFWTFNLHLESPQETMDPPYCHTTSTEMYKACQLTERAEKEICTKQCSFDTHGQSLAALPGKNLHLQPAKVDTVRKLAHNILDENVGCSLESDPNQWYNAASQTPDMDAPNFSPTHILPSEPKSLSSSAFGSQSATNSHCSLTNMNTIPENPQADITDSFFTIDSGTRKRERCQEALPLPESVWVPPSKDTNRNVQFHNTFSNAECDMSNYSDDLSCCGKASAKHDMGVGSFNCTNCSDLDYLPDSSPHFDAFDQLRMNEGSESGDAVRDLGIRYSWSSDSTRIRKTMSPVLSSGNGTLCKNFITGYDCSPNTVPDFLSIVNGSQGDSQCTLVDGELQEIRPEVQGIAYSACLNPSLLLDTGLDQSSISSGYHLVQPDLTPFPCISSCMRVGSNENHTPFMDVAKNQFQKPHARQILTPPIEDYCLFDNILGEHETRRI